MHPRSRFSPLLEITFHVTKSGLPSSARSFSASLCNLFPSEKKLLRLLLLLVAELASLTPLGVELVLCTLLELALCGEGARSLDIAAGRYEDAFAVAAVGGEFSSKSSESEGGSKSSSGAFGSAAVGSALYLFQRSSHWRRLSGGRFSRLAESVSKQYAQWAWVAIVLAACLLLTPGKSDLGRVVAPASLTRRRVMRKKESEAASFERSGTTRKSRAAIRSVRQRYV